MIIEIKVSATKCYRPCRERLTNINAGPRLRPNLASGLASKQNLLMPFFCQKRKQKDFEYFPKNDINRKNKTFRKKSTNQMWKLSKQQYANIKALTENHRWERAKMSMQATSDNLLWNQSRSKFTKFIKPYGRQNIWN